jgi:hypothetical protein
MSTLSTTYVKHGSSAINNITLASTGAVAVNGAMTGAGVDLINKTDFSAASSVSINNCFSVTYDWYKIVSELSFSTAATATLRYRTSGVDNSSSSYNSQRVIGYSTASVITSRALNGTGLTFCDGAAAVTVPIWFDVYSPFKTAITNGISMYSFSPSSATPEISMYGTAFTGTTSFDGFSIVANTGTMTGTIRVYGYKNS